MELTSEFTESSKQRRMFAPKPSYQPTRPEHGIFPRARLVLRCSNRIYIFTALLVSSTLSSCSLPGPISPDDTKSRSAMNPVFPGGTKPLPMVGNSTRTNAQLRETVDNIVNEVLAKQRTGMWNERSQVSHYRLIADNPMLKFPEVNISCGNSKGGTFQVEEARDATVRLFAAYGLSLDAQVPIEGDGYQFEADGFDIALGVGFEIRVDGHPKGYWSPLMAEANSGEDYLAYTELPELEKDVIGDKIAVFVCDPYTIYDGDHKMAMSYYLASVIDYLNWIHGDRTIDYQRVLDETKTSAEDRSTYRTRKFHTLWEWSGRDAAHPWIVNKGAISTTVENGIQVTLEAGTSATYRPTEEIPYGMAATPMWSSLRLAMALVNPTDVPVDFDLSINGDSRSRTRHSYWPDREGVFHYEPDGYVVEEHRTIQSITITNVNRVPLTVNMSSLEAWGYNLNFRAKLP